MMEAEVGDDVFGEDPTVNRLEKVAADIFGKEAGLFCPSGTMTNQIAISVHTRPGDEVICHESSHVYQYEVGGIARNSMSSVRLVQNEHYALYPDEVVKSINADHDWLAKTTMVVAEDTSNRGGGKCYSDELLAELSATCKTHSLSFHLDGARAFNAITKMGHDPIKYGSYFDSISICLSKGLGAPVGSVLLGSKSFIKEARRRRKGMGGGMRQAGILAAAGLFALENNVNRMNEDHILASLIASTLKECSGVTHVIEPETNIVIFDVDQPVDHYLEKLKKEGLLAVAFGSHRIRMVTHLDVNEAMLPQIKDGIYRALNG